MGVKLVQLLIQNAEHWWNVPNERHKPILMICQTNHALDQFLEHCIKECNLQHGVVRVGGQSKSKNLDNFKLAHIKSELYRTNKILDKDVYFRTKDEKKTMYELKERLDELCNKIRHVFSDYGVMSFEALQHFMLAEHVEHFKRDDYFYKFGADYCLIKWLGFFDNLEEEVEEDGEEIMDDEVVVKDELSNDEDEETPNEDDLDDLDDSMNRERMLEEDFDTYDYIIFSERELGKKFKEFEAKSKMSKISNIISCKDIEQMKNMNLNVEGRHNKRQSNWMIQKGGGKSLKNKKNKSELYLSRLFYESSQMKRTNYKNDRIIKAEKNPHQLSYNERFLLYLSWLDSFKLDQDKELDELGRKFDECATSLQELRMQQDRSILEDAIIIGKEILIRVY